LNAVELYERIDHILYKYVNEDEEFFSNSKGLLMNLLHGTMIEKPGEEATPINFYTGIDDDVAFADLGNSHEFLKNRVKNSHEFLEKSVIRTPDECNYVLQSKYLTFSITQKTFSRKHQIPHETIDSMIKTTRENFATANVNMDSAIQALLDNDREKVILFLQLVLDIYANIIDLIPWNVYYRRYINTMIFETLVMSSFARKRLEAIDIYARVDHIIEKYTSKEAFSPSKYQLLKLLKGDVIERPQVQEEGKNLLFQQ
jgi:hypothetical protein